MTADDELTATENAIIVALRDWDVVPADELARARAIFALRTVDEELATLVDASELLAGTRSDEAIATEEADEQTLRFEHDDVTIEIVAVRRSPEATTRLTGQLVPPSAALIVFESPDGEAMSTNADALGRFLVAIAPGVTRLRVMLADRGRPVFTEFFRA